MTLSSQTVTSIYAFFLAMVLYPEVQEKARAELDAVVGQDRLPSFEDRPFLPYVGAIVKECVRWHTVAPSGMRDFIFVSHNCPWFSLAQACLIVPLGMTYTKGISFLKVPWC
jgi:hypothetical protein